MKKDSEKNIEKKGMSRRKFIKNGTCAGLAIAGASTVLGEKSLIDSKKAFAMPIKEHDSMPFDIPANLERPSCKLNPMIRAMPPLNQRPENFQVAEDWMNFLTKSYVSYDGCCPDQPGFTRIDGAAYRAAFSVDQYKDGGNGAAYSRVGAFEWNPPVDPITESQWGSHIRNVNNVEVVDPKVASNAIKVLAKKFGGMSCGIAPYNEQFTYTDNYTLATESFAPNKFDFTPLHTIVVTFEYDYESVLCAPSFLGSFSTGIAEGQMGWIAFSLSIFLKDLGYNAIPIGHDTTINIASAIEAGLGELGRNGLLITPEAGPRVRFCSIITDMPLVNDKPITFGVHEFCEKCNKCAEACPGAAISFGEPTVDGPCEYSSYNGIKRWYINGEKCVAAEGSDNVRSCCAACVVACPYTKPRNWHHDLIRTLTGYPIITPLMKPMDDIFGYGKTYNQKACEKFWEL